VGRGAASVHTELGNLATRSERDVGGDRLLERMIGGQIRGITGPTGDHARREHAGVLTRTIVTKRRRGAAEADDLPRYVVVEWKVGRVGQRRFVESDEVEDPPNTIEVLATTVVARAHQCQEIVGEIDDESDAPEPAVERLADGRLRVPGRTPVDDVSDLVGVRFPDDDWETVAGLVFSRLGHVPTEGEGVVEAGYSFTVERVEGQRIMSVLVAPETPVPG